MPGARGLLPPEESRLSYVLRVVASGKRRRLLQGEGEVMLEGIRRRQLALLLGAALLLPTVALAAPITYFFTSGTVTVTATTGATVLATVPNIPLDGDEITFDAALANPGPGDALLDIVLTMPTSGLVSLSSSYDGYDQVQIDNATLRPANVGYSSSVVLDLAGPPVDNYTFSTTTLNVFGLISATNSSGPPPVPLVTNFFQFNTNTSSGKIFINSATGNIALIGVTIGVIPPGPNSSEPFPLVVKGDFFFNGQVPEPGTALLVGGGLVGLMAAARRSRRS